MKPVDTSAWGAHPPEFIRVLARVVAETGSNQKAADKLGINRASVSTLLANKYPAKIEKMETLIMAWAALVACPYWGQITGDECQTQREKPFISSNPLAIESWKACQRCPNNPARKGQAA